MRLSIGSGRARIGLCVFTGLLPSPIWVIIGRSFTIGLTNVLGCKCAVYFPLAALLPVVLPHSRSCLRPGMLIGGNIFFFREPGTVVRRRRREQVGAERRFNHCE